MNMKQTTLILLVRHGGRCILGILIAGALLVCSGCKSDSDPKCDCPVKAHLGRGDPKCCNGTDCACSLQEYGKINDIPVYREGLTDAQMNGVYAKVNNAYETITIPASKANINPTKVSAIYITNNVNECILVGGKHIIRLSYDLDTKTQNFGDHLLAFGNDELED